MKPRYTYFRLNKFLPAIFLVFLLSACAKPVFQTPEKSKMPVPKTIPGKVEDREGLPQAALVDILTREAQKLADQGDFKNALFIYNQALSQADDTQQSQLITDIEAVLSRTPASDIADFSQVENLTIPEPLILYWLGLNHALEDSPEKAKQALDTFLLKYPGHPYAADAKDLLGVIKTALFKRNTIGCLLPLSGKYAVFGERALKGIQLAVQDLSQKYQQPFNLIIKDTEADPAVTVQAVRELRNEQVAAILGPLLTVHEAGLEAEKLKIPLMALTQKTDFPLEGDYLFANFITPEMQVRTLGAYLFQELGIKRAAILYPDEKYGQRYMALFWDIVDQYGGDIVGVEAYDGNNTDFTVPIQKLTGEYFKVPDFLVPVAPDPIDMETDEVLPETDTLPDMLDADSEASISPRRKEPVEKIQIDFQALFIPDSPSKINLILPQLAYNDATGMYLVGTNLWHHDSLLTESRGYNKNAVITDGFFDKSRNPLTADFTLKFQTLFQEKPKFLEAVAYDTASILFTTAMDETIDGRSAMKDALKGSRIYEGVTGNTVFDTDGMAHKELFLMTIKRNEFIEINR